jgi:hypothetical protein
MLSILGALLGFAGSAVPAVLDLFKNGQDNKQKLEELKLKTELLKQNVDLDIKLFEAKAADAEHARLIAHDTAMASESGFFGGMRKSVRPVITYLFFGLFATVKFAMIQHGIDNGTEFLDVMTKVWDEETQAIFAAVISFWFGNRAIEKRRIR